MFIPFWHGYELLKMIVLMRSTVKAAFGHI
jgi:hypothetical protein